MPVVYIASTAPYAGKTLLTLGLGQWLKAEKKISYFKALGNRPFFVEGTLTDEDAYFVARALELEIPMDRLCPVVLTQDVMIQAFRGELEGPLSRITALAEELMRTSELVLASGYGTLDSGHFLGASNIEIIKALEAKVILVVRFEGEFVADYLLKAQEELGGALGGVVINSLSKEEHPIYQDLVRPFLEKRGVRILGEIPFDGLLKAVSVEELRNFLGARALVAGQEDRLVECFLIGGMQVDKAVTYFEKTPNFGVIVGGDRSDIQLAAIETGAFCLILTGGLYPNDIILAKAEERKVAVLVVPDDTYSTAQKVEKIPFLIRIRHPLKLKRAFELAAHGLDFALLKETLEP